MRLSFDRMTSVDGACALGCRGQIIDIGRWKVVIPKVVGWKMVYAAR